MLYEVITDGLKLRYLESGRGKKKHLVFIHGLGSAADRWMNIPDELSSEFHSIAIDLPGFGESVITSYSIHYTKLYEVVCWKGRHRQSDGKT